MVFKGRHPRANFIVPAPTSSISTPSAWPLPPTSINPAALEFNGLSDLDERRWPNVLDYVHPEDRARVRDELWPVMMQEGRWFGEMRLQHFATGAAIPFFVDWFRIDDPRSVQPMNIAAVCRDLTTQKRSEAELRHLNETLEQRVAARNRELVSDLAYAQSRCTVHA